MSSITRKIASKRRNNIKKKLYSRILRQMRTDSSKFLSVRDVCRILGVDLASVKLKGTSPDDMLTSICAWDFYLLPGSLYAALPLYGNLTPEEAIKRGAAVLLTDHQEGDYPCIVVDDVMDAFCRLCGKIHENFSARTIAVTGSVGKTTTKDLTRCVAEEAFNVYCDAENNNMATLIGYLIQRLPKSCSCYIQEVHEGDPGSAESISDIIHPDIAVITNIGESHLGNFGSFENLVKGVTDITAGMPKDGIVIIDRDDEPSFNAPWDRKVVTVSVKDPDADYFADNIRISDGGLEFDIVCSKGRIAAGINLFGLHNVTDALLAFAAGVESGIDTKKAVRGLKKYRARGMRQNVVRDGNRYLYLDCFNAAVKSIKSSLETLSALPVKEGGRRIAVLGDMAELGDESEAMHREVGKMAAESGIDVLICYGPLSEAMADEALKTGKIQVCHTDRLGELNKMIKSKVGKADAVLFKASHSTNLIAAVRACFPKVYYREIVTDQLRRQIARESNIQ